MPRKETRQWGLFKKVDGRWVRQHPEISAAKTAAIHIFQNIMLQMATQGEEFSLRPLRK